MGDKRIKIIMASKDIFEAMGYHEAKISEIAKLAGVGKGTVYEYFDSKESLFEEMVIYLIDMSFDLMTAKINTQSTALDKLRVIQAMEKEISLNHGKLFSLILSRISNASDELKIKFFQTRERELKTIESIISDGIKEGVFKDINTSHFALIFKGAMGQAHMSASCHPENEAINSDSHLSEELFDVLIDSIKS